MCLIIIPCSNWMFIFLWKCIKASFFKRIDINFSLLEQFAIFTLHMFAAGAGYKLTTSPLAI